MHVSTSASSVVPKHVSSQHGFEPRQLPTCTVPRGGHFHDEISDDVEGPIRRPERGGSEWELIKILLEGDWNSNKMNSLGRTPKITHSALLPSICQNHVATGVLLVLGANTTSNLNTHAPTTAETTRKPAVRRGAVRLGMGAVRPPPPSNQEILRNTSSEHQNTPCFHQQRSLVKAMLATRKFGENQNSTQGPRGS
jgi:hypothetical protein